MTAYDADHTAEKKPSLTENQAPKGKPVASSGEARGHRETTRKEREGTSTTKKLDIGRIAPDTRLPSPKGT